ncbi:MAG: ABC transporter substrate-binding protein [Actinomycetota bacterium]
MSKRHLAAVLVLLTLPLVACEGEVVDDPFPVRSPVGRPTSSDSLVIGLVGTLSGPESWRGEDAFEGADLAVHELNHDRPDGVMPVELVALDDEGDVDKAKARIEEIAGLERSIGLIYAGPPEALSGSEGVLAARGIAAISIFGDLYGREALTKHTFQAAPSKVWEARRLASYLGGDRGYRKIGIIAPNDDEGRSAIESLRASVPPRTVVVGATYVGSVLLEGSLDELRDAHVEAVVVDGPPGAFRSAIDALTEMGALYEGTESARIASARPRDRRARVATGWWHPQLAGFDAAISPRVGTGVPPGTVASDSYARGVHYLPVPSFRSFRIAFEEWWGGEPLGWEQRSYDAVRLIGWAAERAEPGADLSIEIEATRDQRFGGLDITLGPDDHTMIDQTRVGLWVVPRAAATVKERDRLPENLPWVPLARGFSLNGRVTDVAPEDWDDLFRKAPPEGAPPPRNGLWRFGVATPRSDPWS